MQTTNMGNEPYPLPEKHAHLLRVLILCIVLAIIVFAAWLFSVYFGSPKPTVPIDTPITTLESLEQQKREVLERLQKASTQPLTQEEKINAINIVSSEGTYYTVDEKRMIIKALRGE